MTLPTVDPFSGQMGTRINVLAPYLLDIEAAQRHQVVMTIFHMGRHLDFASGNLVSDHLVVICKGAVRKVVHRCIRNLELVEKDMVCLPAVVVLEWCDGCFVDSASGVVDEIDLVQERISKA